MANNLFTLTLLKAFSILDCFEDDRQEIGIKEIANMIDMPQSSVYRIIQSLEFVGLIFQNRETKKYRIGIKLAELSGKCQQLDEYLRIASGFMRQLAAQTGETINLAAANCDKIIYLHKIESHHVLRPNFLLNTCYPAHSTALGRVLLAELSAPALRWVYDSNEQEMGMPFPEFQKLIRQVKQDGFAYDDQVFSPGLRCVAAPVLGPGGNVMFSLSISAPAIRMTDSVYLQSKDLVVDFAHRISEEIQAAE